MSIAVYPGSFDPVTLGHEDIIKRAACIFDEVVIGVLDNNGKSPLFSVENRVKMLRKVVRDMPNVKVLSFDGLLVDFAGSVNANVVIRGLRTGNDFEYELQMSHVNHKLSSNIDTVFFATSLECAYLSSSIVKEVARYDTDIKEFVPEVIVEDVLKKIKKKETDQYE